MIDNMGLSYIKTTRVFTETMYLKYNSKCEILTQS